jgi:glutamine synthetase
MCDHYMAAPSHATAALACMQEIQAQCFRLGIPLRTRHREVAPNQYEFAPLFGTATTQIDQNLVVMQIIEETAAQYGLAALQQEKPFNNINGSGKHNNWSIGTHDGVNLLNIGQITEAAGDDAFPTIMAAIVSAIDKHGDLMRMSISSPGNDFRLGACEAPPAIVSTYLGDDMTDYLQSYAKGGGKYEPASKELDMGVDGMRKMEIPAQDRNRTSPFPYGGHRFEFRAVGSAQNVSLVNVVLNTITAAAFKEVADRIEGGETAQAVAADLINTHVPKVVFNGDNYDEANQEMLTKRGVWRIDSGVDAICRFSDPKNTALFESMGVLKANECAARQEVLLDHYVGTVDIEAKCMVDMINKHVLPSAKAAELPQVAALEAALTTLGKGIEAIHASAGKPQADLARVLRLETMIDIREVCDAAEGLCPADLWTLPTYTDLLFLDQTTNVDKNYFP